MKKSKLLLSLSLSTIIISTLSSVALASCKADPQQPNGSIAPTFNDFEISNTLLSKVIEGEGSLGKLSINCSPTPDTIKYQFEDDTSSIFSDKLKIDGNNLTLSSGLAVGDYPYTIKVIVNKTGYQEKIITQPFNLKIVPLEILIKGETSFNNVYNGDDFASTNYTLVNSLGAEINYDDVNWGLEDAPSNLHVNDVGQLNFSKNQINVGSYDFKLKATLKSKPNVHTEQQIQWEVNNIPPAPESATIEGPIVVHALKGVASNANPHQPMDEGAQYSIDVYPATSSKNFSWSIENGTVNETTANPYHTQYDAQSKNNIVPSWLTMSTNGLLSWVNSVQAAADPLGPLGYINWRFVVRATSTDYPSIHYDYSIYFMVSKRDDGWANPTTIDIKSPGWSDDFSISTNNNVASNKQYYSNADASRSILETDTFQNATWELTGDVPSFVDIDQYGLLSWTSDSVPGTYSFNIKVTSLKISTVTKTKTINFTVTQPQNPNDKIKNYLYKAIDSYNKIMPILDLVSQYSSKTSAIIAALNNLKDLLTAFYELYTICNNAYNNNLQPDQSRATTLFNTIKTLIVDPNFISSITSIINGMAAIKTAFDFVFNKDKQKISKMVLPSLSENYSSSSTSHTFLIALTLMLRSCGPFIFLSMLLLGLGCSLVLLPNSLIWSLIF